MDSRTPCEKTIWYVIPSVKRELASYLTKDKSLSRKAVAEKLCVSEAAICQYLKKKRGSHMKFGKKEMEKIREIGDSIAEGKSTFPEKICQVCKAVADPCKTG